jgi:hypothetical protein
MNEQLPATPCDRGPKKGEDPRTARDKGGQEATTKREQRLKQKKPWKGHHEKQHPKVETLAAREPRRRHTKANKKGETQSGKTPRIKVGPKRTPQTGWQLPKPRAKGGRVETLGKNPKKEHLETRNQPREAEHEDKEQTR